MSKPRRVHYIKQNHNSESPQACIWFDTETKQVALRIKNRRSGNSKINSKQYSNNKPESKCVEQRLVFGWAAYAERYGGGNWTKPQWKRFTTKEEFWAWVETKQRKKRKCYLFCHNTSFDLPVLDAIRQLALTNWHLKMAVIDAPPTILKYKKDTSSIVVLDTLNIFRMSLKELGKQVGLTKLESNLQWDNPEQDDLYCRRDVEIIMKACIVWFDFLVDNDLGGFAHTLAGQALRAYRHRFMPFQILIDNNEKATFTSREAYYGGRTECFRLGYISESLTLLDVNSMYPSKMQRHLFPHHCVGYDKRPTIKSLQYYLKDRAVCSKVTLRTSEACYPKRNKDKLIFPIGEFTTFLSTPELKYALEQGHIVKVHDCAIYEQQPIFKDFIEYFYNERIKASAKGDTTSSNLFKIMMNSLYGKFGQRGIVWEANEQTDDLSAKTWTEFIPETGEKIKYRQLGGLVQEQIREQESRESFPAIAAHVTAYARMSLWSFIKQAGHKNVYYTDTDSLLVNEQGLYRLSKEIDNKTLGKLKLEDKYIDAEIFGNKDYRFGIKVRTKGVKKTARWLTTNKVEQDQWSSLKGLLSGGSIDKPLTKTITKELKRVYTKGIVSHNGVITPLVYVDDMISLPSPSSKR